MRIIKWIKWAYSFNGREVIRKHVYWFLLAVLSWTFVIEILWTPSVYSFTNPVLVPADAEASEIGSSVSMEAGQVGEILTESSPQPDIVIRKIAEGMGFTEADRLIRLAGCESTFNPACGELNNPDCINPKNGSYDRGWFQISRKWHPEVSDECAFDLECATEASIDILNRLGFDEWSCNV
jgi:hypothetical protein